MGIFQVFVFIPIIPEMIERIQVDLEIAEGEHEDVDLALNDQVNEAYTLLYAFAMFISPLLGSYLHSTLGSRKTCDYVAIVNLGVAAISFVFNCGFFVFSEDRAFKTKLEELKEKGQKAHDNKDPDVQSVVSKSVKVRSMSKASVRPQRANFGNTQSLVNVYSGSILLRKASVVIHQKQSIVRETG